ncbi:DUF5131 family protein [Mycobacteroides immunogenum]|uniref:Phage Gp37Gp68 n=1 Tax=Mycobacteroides immunogenum TaxID=83262 RepID=A0A7V8LR46_9MYCO|nr:phage Gp37/Gp68 family protein [Mycobacteroides immunogenum]AMT72066.1 hypothetical protein ABG82_18995 [Mycobacteroides immunogenum]ANO05196.1 hypothetical protein BAB75_19265 [Mycobacteroides immunogenum]KIU40135.1 hypothetical protein TL11_12685 [Mycobacteroides immunogenum]KPG13632.1 hypothetical protein AN909_04960 [Mycobacteroides immunogenum]KPG14447.1 hypothetical protein AN908_07905 [Mycobacteroides immunogenum]
MGDKTGIEWTDATWNPVTGCDKVSPGCDHCYAETFAERWRGTEGHYFATGFDVQLRPDKLDLPLRWTKPRKVFVNSMSDLFHDRVPDEYVASVWAIMALAPHHTFQLLTKRHGRMHSLVGSSRFAGLVYMAINSMLDHGNPLRINDIAIMAALDGFARGQFKVLDNVQLIVSVEDQKRAELRIPVLLDTPAAVRGISGEPLLGPVVMKQHWLHPVMREPSPENNAIGRRIGKSNGVGFIDWVIVGGESGPGARPMHPDWVRSLRDQCVAADVPFLFKQWGEHEPTSRGIRGYSTTADRFVYTDGSGSIALADAASEHKESGATMQRVGKKRAGRELDGRTWDQYPEAVTNA